MKIKLLIITLLFISTNAISQVVANQVDDFENGTTLNWIGGPNVVNVATDGPAGVDDNFLRTNATGGNGPGSKMVIRNSAQWFGNYTTQNIVGIRFNARVATNNLTLRIAMEGDGGVICSTTGISVTAGSGWTTVTIPIDAPNMQTVTASNATDGFDIGMTLGNCNQFRIISSLNPAYEGESIVAILEVDNITALTTLGINDLVQQNDFKISPNPSKSKLNLVLPNATTNARLDVFDVLGKKVLSKEINNLTSSIDASKWNNGVYLVRITSATGTQTKRFVKQ